MYRKRRKKKKKKKKKKHEYIFHQGPAPLCTILVDSPFPPPHLQILYLRASSACPTAAKNLFRPTDPLEYIVGQGIMKYGGEMLMEFTILNDFE
jgi:hypothetical protein